MAAEPASSVVSLMAAWKHRMNEMEGLARRLTRSGDTHTVSIHHRHGCTHADPVASRYVSKALQTVAPRSHETFLYMGHSNRWVFL